MRWQILGFVLLAPAPSPVQRPVHSFTTEAFCNVWTPDVFLELDAWTTWRTRYASLWILNCVRMFGISLLCQQMEPLVSFNEGSTFCAAHSAPLMTLLFSGLGLKNLPLWFSVFPPLVWSASFQWHLKSSALKTLHIDVCCLLQFSQGSP